MNPEVNAVVAVDAERALAQAREADEQREPAGPLHGVPFTVKDNLEAAGLPMTIGAPEREGIVAERDATVVVRMRAAGAILIGKTNCPTYGGGIETDNPVHGRTNNPFDLERTPGGSSGGEAAAIAAGCSPCGLGTDSGASVRLPAHFCGLAAIKPTAGRVPVTGVLDDLGQIGALADPRTQIGVLARAVDDVALVLRVVAGPDGRDGGVAAPVAVPKPGSVAGLRVAMHTHTHLAAPDRATIAAVHDAGAALRDAGALVEEAEPPRGGHELTIDIWRSYGDELSAEQLYALLRRWDAFRAEMLAWGADHDLVLCPVFPGPARAHGDMNRPGEIDPTSFTTPHNLTGWPAATVRTGTSPDDLPIGVQLVAHPWRDDVALSAARELEQALGGWQPPSRGPAAAGPA